MLLVIFNREQRIERKRERERERRRGEKISSNLFVIALFLASSFFTGT